MNNKYLLCCELVGAYIGEKELNNELFVGLNDIAWRELIEFARDQGVLYITISSISLLPVELKPCEDLWIEFVGLLYYGEQRFYNKQEIAISIVEMYKKAGLKTLILKGFSLADLYHQPSYREGGDLDIWMFGEFQKSVELIKQNGVNIAKITHKGTNYAYRGLDIDNHKSFSNVRKFRVDGIVEKSLQQNIIDEAPELFSLGDSGAKAYRASATFNAIFVARHIMCHFSNNLTLHQLCDWVVLLNKQGDKINKAYVKEVFVKIGLWDLLCGISIYCEKYLGLKPENNFVDRIESSNYETMITSIITGKENRKGRLANYFATFKHRKTAHNLSTIGLLWSTIKIYIYSFWDKFR